MSIVCLHYFTLKWASSGGGGRIGESFNGDRASVWGDESLLEMDSGNDCNVNKHVMLLKVVKMVNLMSCVCVRACVSRSVVYTTLCKPMDCSPPGSFVHGILQARILDWVNIPFSRGSSRPRDQTQAS